MGAEDPKHGVMSGSYQCRTARKQSRVQSFIDSLTHGALVTGKELCSMRPWMGDDLHAVARGLLPVALKLLALMSGHLRHPTWPPSQAAWV